MNLYALLVLVLVVAIVVLVNFEARAGQARGGGR